MNSNRGVSRRTVVTGAAAIAAIAAVGGPLTTASPAAAAVGPTTVEGVVTLALAQVGKTLAQLQGTVMTESPWGTYQGDWCAVFGSWLTRGAGIPYRSLASGLYAAGTPVSSPAKGDIIHYQNNGHVGIVVDVVGGVARTVEGNTHTHPWPLATVSKFNQPWAGGYRFSRPNYQGSEPPTAPPTNGKKKMWLFFDLAGSGYLATDSGVTSVGLQEYNLLFRVINSNQATSPFSGGVMPAQFNSTEIGIINAALARTRIS